MSDTHIPALFGARIILDPETDPAAIPALHAYRDAITDPELAEEIRQKWFPDSPATRTFRELRTTGILWMINRTIFHPRGYALAIHRANGTAIGWTILGDGKESWNMGSEPTPAEIVNGAMTEDELFAKFNELLATASLVNGPAEAAQRAKLVADRIALDHEAITTESANAGLEGAGILITGSAHVELIGGDVV